MIIRQATGADAAALAKIYAPYVLHGTASFETEPPDTAEMTARVERISRSGWPWLVAEKQDAVIGYAYYSQFRDRAAYRYSAEVSIYLDQAAIGHGIGRLLLTALIDAAKAAGFRELFAVIGDSDNAASIGLHEALGFRHAGLLQRAGFKFGRWLNVVYMQLSLDAADG
jgi:phosphinothricin acetyltransferase